MRGRAGTASWGAGVLGFPWHGDADVTHGSSHGTSGGHGRPRVGVVRGFEKRAAVGTTATCGPIRGGHELVMSRIQH